MKSVCRLKRFCHVKRLRKIIFACAIFVAFFAANVNAEPSSPPEQGIPQSAQSLGHKGGFVTNSMLVTWIVAVGVILFARFATRKIQEVPSGAQNFLEWLVEGLYGFLESIIGT